jgi:hypothetical protein
MALMTLQSRQRRREGRKDRKTCNAASAALQARDTHWIVPSLHLGMQVFSVYLIIASADYG